MSFQFAIGATLASSFGAAFIGAANKIVDLHKVVEKLNKSTQNTAKTQNALAEAFKKGTISAETYQKVMRRTSASLNFTNNSAQLLRKLSEQQNSFAQAGQKADLVQAQAAGWAAMTKSMAAPISRAMQFESVMADVRKVVDFDTPQQFKEMSNDILQLSQRIPVSAEGLAQIMASAGQSGIARNELLGFTESAAKMGVAFDITAEQAGDMMAKWRTAFKMSQPEVINLADKINYLGNKTAATAPLISEVVTRIGPLGSIGGVASGEIAAMGASIVGAGINSEIAATGIKNLILGLTAGTAVTKQQAGAFAQLGLDSEEVAASMQKDAKGTMLMVLESIKSLDKVKQTSVIKRLFGKESIGAIAPLIANLDNFKRNLSLVGGTEHNGSMEKEYEERAKTAANAVQLLKNAGTSLAVTLGSSLLPEIAKGAKVFAEWAKAIAAWGKEHPALVKAIFAFILGFSAFMTIGYSAFAVILRIRQAFIGLKLAITGIRLAFTALKAAMLLNPYIAIILALAAAAFIVYQNWEPIKAFFINLWNGAKNAVSNFVSFVQSKLSEAYDWVMKKWQALKDFLAHPITGTVNIIKNVMGGPIGNATAQAQKDYNNYKTNARGGIYGRGAFLTSFAEASPEAAIPIDGSARSAGLWQETGRRLGLMPTAGSSSVSVNYSPRIEINGNADQTQVQQAMDMSLDRLKRMLRDLQQEKRRLAYD